MGIFEVLAVEDGIRSLIMQQAPSGRIKEVAQAAGMTSMRSDGLRKVRTGLTTMEEVLRVTQLDEEILPGQVAASA